MKVVDVWADWCGPCKLMAPVLESLESQYGIPVEKISADENPEYLEAQGIMSIPTLLVCEDGKITKRIIGYRPLSRLVVELGLAP